MRGEVFYYTLYLPFSAIENVFGNILLRRERLSERTPRKVKQQSELHSNMQSVGRNSAPPLQDFKRS